MRCTSKSKQPFSKPFHHLPTNTCYKWTSILTLYMYFNFYFLVYDFISARWGRVTAPVHVTGDTRHITVKSEQTWHEHYTNRGTVYIHTYIHSGQNLFKEKPLFSSGLDWYNCRNTSKYMYNSNFESTRFIFIYMFDTNWPSSELNPKRFGSFYVWCLAKWLCLMKIMSRF